MATIVVGVDGSQSRAALSWALEESRLRQSSLRVVMAWTPPDADDVSYAPVDARPEIEQALASVGERVIEDALAAVLAGEEAGVPVERRAVPGSPASTLLRTAQDAELLVVGSRGHGGFAGLLLGSVSQQVAHHAPCPVVIVRERRGLGSRLQ